MGMLFVRRQLLRTLSFAFGSSFLLGGPTWYGGADNHAPKVSPPPAGAVVRDGIAEDGNGKVTESEDSSSEPKIRKRWLWYQQHWGSRSYQRPRGIPWQQEAGPTAFAPFKETAAISGYTQGLDAELSSPGSRTKWQPLRAAGSRSD